MFKQFGRWLGEAARASDEHGLGVRLDECLERTYPELRDRLAQGQAIRTIAAEASSAWNVPRVPLLLKYATYLEELVDSDNDGYQFYGRLWASWQPRSTENAVDTIASLCSWSNVLVDRGCVGKTVGSEQGGLGNFVIAEGWLFFFPFRHESLPSPAMDRLKDRMLSPFTSMLPGLEIVTATWDFIDGVHDGARYAYPTDRLDEWTTLLTSHSGAFALPLRSIQGLGYFDQQIGTALGIFTVASHDTPALVVREVVHRRGNDGLPPAAQLARLIRLACILDGWVLG